MVLPSGADVVAIRSSLLDPSLDHRRPANREERVHVTVFMVIAVRLAAYSGLTAATGSA
jgi:hypothetical protein